jgi:glycine cleavage system H lipoate-binding protein
VDEATAIVMVEVPEPGDAIDAGTKLTVTPVG